MHPSRVSTYPGEPACFPSFSLWQSRMKVWPGPPCWKLTNERRAGSNNAVMKQTKLNVALIQKLNRQHTAITGSKWATALIKSAWVKMSLCYCRQTIFSKILFSSSGFSVSNEAPHQRFSWTMHTSACIVHITTKHYATYLCAEGYWKSYWILKSGCTTHFPNSKQEHTPETCSTQQHMEICHSSVSLHWHKWPGLL